MRIFRLKNGPNRVTWVDRINDPVKWNWVDLFYIQDDPSDLLDAFLPYPNRYKP